MTQRTLLVTLLALAMTSCSSGGLREVATNGGGVLDCPSDVILYTMLDMNTSQPGAETAVGSLSEIGVDGGLPEGTSREESPGLFVFEDSSGNRIGRVKTNRFDTGWFVEWTERCG